MCVLVAQHHRAPNRACAVQSLTASANKAKRSGVERSPAGGARRNLGAVLGSEPVRGDGAGAGGMSDTPLARELCAADDRAANAGERQKRNCVTAFCVPLLETAPANINVPAQCARNAASMLQKELLRSAKRQMLLPAWHFMHCWCTMAACGPHRITLSATASTPTEQCDRGAWQRIS